MSNLNSNTMVTLINTSTQSGIISLPFTTDIPFRSIMFKDFTGYTNQFSTITISTSGNDTFENGSNLYVMNNPYSFASLYADTYHNKWLKLNNTDGWSMYPATQNLNMNNYQICNLQLNYCNTFSNISVVPTLIAASPQTFSGPLYDQPLNTPPYSLATTNAESNYLYFNSNQSIWKIHITMAGYFGNHNTNNRFYFTLSNTTSGIETPFINYTSNNTFYIFNPSDNIQISLNDTINLSDMIQSSITPYTPITLNMYCANDSGLHFTSSNMNSWSNPNNISALQAGYGVAYGNNTWIVVGQNSIAEAYIATSYDNGVTWVGGTDISNYTYLPVCACYGNGIWLIGSILDTTILYSTDGTNFIPSPFNLFNSTYGIAYGNGTFVAGGVSSNASNYTIAYSTDGINWTLSSATPSNQVNAIAYANDIFCAVGNDIFGAVATSPDGINWTQYNPTTNLVCIAYGAGRWFAGDGNGNIYYSTDNWYTYGVIYSVPYFTSLVFGDTLVGTDFIGNIWYSGDVGNTWNSNNLGLSNAFAVAYGNGLYVATGSNYNSNCIVTTQATNILSYTLEPTTIQPQTYTLPAPTIDWANTVFDLIGNLTITWLPVTNATYYKVFASSNYKVTLNKYVNKAAVPLNRSLTSNLFDNDSGPITSNSYFIPNGYIEKNYYVFAYNNGVRSSFPTTQIYTNHPTLELWPVEQVEFHGGSNGSNCTTYTVRNLYNNKSVLLSSNTYGDSNYRNVQSAIIGTNTFLSNH
jgi:hypothetical protein